MSRRLVTTTKNLFEEKKWASTVRNNNDSRARDKTLKQLSLAILQFVVFTSQFHLIYLTLSSSLLMRFWIHFYFFLCWSSFHILFPRFVALFPPLQLDCRPTERATDESSRVGQSWAAIRTYQHWAYTCLIFFSPHTIHFWLRSDFSPSSDAAIAKLHPHFDSMTYSASVPRLHFHANNFFTRHTTTTIHD